MEYILQRIHSLTVENQTPNPHFVRREHVFILIVDEYNLIWLHLDLLQDLAVKIQIRLPHAARARREHAVEERRVHLVRECGEVLISNVRHGVDLDWRSTA